MKTRFLLSLLASCGALAGNLSAATTLFSGATGTVYKATSDNANATLTNSSGAISLTTSASWVDNQSAYVFGNFAAQTLGVGQSITISLTAVVPTGNNNFYISLSGAKGATPATADRAFAGFERSYDGFRVRQNVGSTTVTFNSWQNEPSGTAVDRNILLGNTTSGGLSGTGTTGNDPQRYDANDTAAFTMTVGRVAGGFIMDYTLNITGGSGVQSFSSSVFDPSVNANWFQVADAFTTFAVGLSGTMDKSTTLSLSNLTVTYVPEPRAALLGSLGLLALLRRRRG